MNDHPPRRRATLTQTTSPRSAQIQIQNLRDVLEFTQQHLKVGTQPEVVDQLAGYLREIRLSCDDEQWRQVVAQCRQHPVTGLLQECPYTKRGFDKPRGYAGDAVLLDLIYSQVSPEGTSELGKTVFARTTGSSGARSVEHRRQRLSRVIDDTARRVANPNILAVACGHLREAHDSLALKDGAVANLYAADQDEASIREVVASCSDLNVTPLAWSLKNLLTDKTLPKLDLIYCAGIYDYLPDPLALSTTRHLASRLNPGGELLVANFVPENHARGYMEVFMDWWLILRSESDFENLSRQATLNQDFDVSVFKDDLKNVVYAKLTRDS